MIDLAMIPDPGLPLADGYYLKHACAALHALGIRTPEDFTARYGVDIRALTAFGLLWLVARSQAERELHLNALYRAGLHRYRTSSNPTTMNERAARASGNCTTNSSPAA